MALVWGGAACYNGHRVGGDFSVIGPCHKEGMGECEGEMSRPFKREKFRKLRQDARRLAAERAQWLWFGAALLAITVIVWVVIFP
jgi:hypothetical protein